MSKKLSNKHLWLPVSILCMVLSFLYLSVCVMDNDGYFISASGRYITAMHSVPKYNPFMSTAMVGLAGIVAGLKGKFRKKED